MDVDPAAGVCEKDRGYVEAAILGDLQLHLQIQRSWSERAQNSHKQLLGVGLAPMAGHALRKAVFQVGELDAAVHQRRFAYFACQDIRCAQERKLVLGRRPG